MVSPPDHSRASGNPIDHPAAKKAQSPGMDTMGDALTTWIPVETMGPYQVLQHGFPLVRE
ncbi:MAG: hypothetical protein TH68_08230 [Candidatus Synechococcus spongiarum 142]|uniref:Uncharacterized protein n=1 Tax=Candidatus Synechococcus spongiarum 142 TaxID=1608213 RepID=A0A6N3XA36_9SYNE|nr:MAG: hypothetical protein TH68_08230 [Candidatus Synechococcus spongiarum 142]